MVDCYKCMLAVLEQEKLQMVEKFGYEALLKRIRALERSEKELKQAEDELRISKKLLQDVMNLVPAYICAKNLQGKFILANKKLTDFYGTTVEDLTGTLHADICEDEEELKGMMADDLDVIVSGKPKFIPEEKMQNPDGSFSILETYKIPFSASEEQAVLIVSSDITERKRLEREREKLEEQFHQSQKLESVGRLAGGVAHDLNNLLVPILGYGEMLLEDLEADDSRKASIEQIVEAGKRSRDIVHQLLAFSRKQALNFKALDLNKVLTGFEGLLRRTIREDIEIKIHTVSQVPLIRGDIGQLEQVIMNLTVNSQDAMPRGGTLTFRIFTTELDENFAATHKGVKPGKYVVLSVQDSGLGMDEETCEHIFEPFFSTKGEQGTGLGLSTVYGIVKQHGGNIWVSSEKDNGTIFKIYLPVSEETTIQEDEAVGEPLNLEGSETILLVEDNKQVRTLACTILSRLGYEVIDSANGKDALRILRNYDGSVHLLLTDVVMPEMAGNLLFEQVSQQVPGIKVLYMSGYPNDVISHRGILDEGVNFIQKPFSVHDLAVRVRASLDEK